MVNILKKIQSVVKNRTSYRVGLLQAKVYRILKTFTTQKLSAYGLSTIDWAMLGLLKDNSKGIQSSHLADELGVEAPFVTVLTNKLKKMELISTKADVNDSRVKIVYLTEKGMALVPLIESYILKQMKVLFGGISPREIVMYVSVLHQIVQNSKKINLQNSRHSDYMGV